MLLSTVAFSTTQKKVKIIEVIVFFSEQKDVTSNQLLVPLQTIIFHNLTET